MALPGEFVLRTFLKNTLVTARDGGHHSIDALITTATAIGPNEKFTLDLTADNTGTTFKTAGGFFVSARGGGGIGGSPDDDTQTFQTERTAVAADAIFRLRGPATNGVWTIETANNHFVTAVGGGGKSTRAFHTDATNALSWESFYLLKTGDLGPGFRYAIRPAGTGNIPGQGEKVSFLTAIGGGGRRQHALTFNGPFQPESLFGLVRQPDGSFAIRTANGPYVTADDGGGLAHGTPQLDNLYTAETHIQDWERFKIVEKAPGLYTIQTVSGFFVAVKQDLTNISTRISDVDAAPSIGYTAVFELMFFGA
jgi:hypothetical protein